MMDQNFWKGKRVFITGHTGFKGSWISLWLQELGSHVTGYALSPPTEPSLFNLLELEQEIPTIFDDIRNFESLQAAIFSANPDVVIHMAAQPLVRYSYHHPIETYAVNVMGTVNLLEAVRNAIQAGSPIKAVINVTTDKCYDNKEWAWGYRENEELGGYDPYSNSKACSELVTSCYRNSFFHPKHYGEHGVALASVRAGNVIGGGDWAIDRLIPDCLRSIHKNEKILIRHPGAIRPWQHVLEPLSGYLLLAQKLIESGFPYAEAWNFGPHDYDAKSVEWIVNRICDKWGDSASYEIEQGDHPHEAGFLKLDCSKARLKLGWAPKWNLEQTLDNILDWTKSYMEGVHPREICLRQIDDYQKAKPIG